MSCLTSSMMRWADLRREPFRLFFPLGVLCGCLGVGHWLAYALGWRGSYVGFYHASMQVGSYLTCFVVGFLFTALPRFSASHSASSMELALALGLLLGHVVGLWRQWWAVAEGCFVGVLLLVILFAGRRFKSRPVEMVGPPPEFVWILIALGCGVFGSMLLIGAQQGWWPGWLLAVGRPMVQQGFAVGVVVGVGGFLAPRLMGHALHLRSDVTREALTRIRRRRSFWHLLMGTLFCLSFWIEGAGAIGPAYLLRAATITTELTWTTRWYYPPVVTDLYVRLLWVSLWMVMLGLWGAGLVPPYRVVMLHLVFVGGLSLMTFAIGTMVVFSHTGQAERLRQPLWGLRVVALGVAGALAARGMAEWQHERYFQWLGVAAGCWLVAGIEWLLLTVPLLLRPVAPEAFERMHEAAKSAQRD